MATEIVVKEVGVVIGLGVRKEIGLGDIQAIVNNTYITVVEQLRGTPSAISGPPIHVTHALSEDGADIEVCIPVSDPTIGHAPLQARQITASKVASLTVHGSYEEHVFPAFAQLSSWVSSSGQTQTGPIRTIYIVSPVQTGDPSQWVTELQAPIA
eukprot:TRINITY_DN381_c0_g1_i1.p1 TRINITY_DN381_c0_g1~~TRINITY_DN381_c0_g1_i1.p1  ORF type:complete len:165 (-),score=107.90 TRINITY_DN381_c0_g1_i1:270-734(-)